MASARDETFPGMLRRSRLRAGMTVARLAERVNFSRSHLSNLELGHRGCPSELVAILDRELEADGDLVRAWEADGQMKRREVLLAGAVLAIPVPPSRLPGERAVGSSLVAELRRGLLVREPVRTVLTDMSRLARDVRTVHTLYHRAEYAAACRNLSSLIAEAEALVLGSGGSGRTHRLLALAYLAASKLAAKAGDRELDWIAADRALSSARVAGDSALCVVSQLQIASALLNLPGRRDDAEAVAEAADAALTDARLVDDAATISARGTTLLFKATVASRSGRKAASRRWLHAAAEVARRLGRDGNELGTAFGPTNVALHRVAMFNALGSPAEAIAAAGRISTSRLPVDLIGRRAQVHLDLAAAFGESAKEDGAAVLHLLEAERLAPQTVQVNHRPQALLAELMRRERRTATPGLRALADRAGVRC
ncbi:helix-turn-helix domain-containing protein [Catellatospora methionotrophica]|uniref:helix-turn-helix domain-containing protein n=1 Tax=Catellatospora methionotrophica TaxID=121620 RepID=UPI0033CDA204